jgi:hypothetical protein
MFSDILQCCAIFQVLKEPLNSCRLYISKSGNHWFWIFAKIGIKEPWISIISKAFRNERVSWKNQQVHEQLCDLVKRIENCDYYISEPILWFCLKITVMNPKNHVGGGFLFLITAKLGYFLFFTFYFIPTCLKLWAQQHLYSDPATVSPKPISICKLSSSLDKLIVHKGRETCMWNTDQHVFFSWFIHSLCISVFIFPPQNTKKVGT